MCGFDVSGKPLTEWIYFVLLSKTKYYFVKKSVSILFTVFTMMMIVISGSSTSASPALATTHPHKGIIDYSQELAWQQEHLWNMGKSLTIGDSYTYKICDPDAILNYSAESYHFFTKNLEHNGSLCYTIQMDFVNLIATDQNQIGSLIWVIQAAITDDATGDTRHSVFHVDSESFEVRSADTIHPDTIRYAKSLQNTVFSLHKYTASESKLLQTGVSWGEVTEYNSRGNNPDMKVLEKTEFNATSYHYKILKQNTVVEQQQMDVFLVGYEIDIKDKSDFVEKEKKNKNNKDKEGEGETKNSNNVTNSFLVNSHLPFPVTGEFFNPSYVIEPQKEFEFELIKYMETKSNKPPIPITPVPTPDDPDNVEEDLPNTIKGTIELTFPDDPVPDKVVPDDPVPDKVVPDKVVPDDPVPDDPVPDVVPDDVTPDGNPQSTQDDSTLPVIVILAIVLGVAGIVLWKRPSFQWKKKKSQNVTRKKVTFNDKIMLEIDTEQ